MGQLEHQACREAWGAVLVVELLLLDETVQNCVLLLINDCAPVLVVLEEGISVFSEAASGRRGHTQGVYTSGSGNHGPARDGGNSSSMRASTTGRRNTPRRCGDRRAASAYD